MVRETRYLYVGNLPESINEERILDLFNSYGKIQGVKLLTTGSDGANIPCAIVAFMDIKSASKAHDTEIIFEEKPLVTHYNESSMVVTVHPDKRQANVVSHTGALSSKSKVLSPDGLPNEVPSESRPTLSKSLIHCQSPPSDNYPGSHRFDEGVDKPLGMLIRGFPTRSTDSSIRDGLYHDYKKYGKVLSVNVIGQGEERHAIVSFKKPEDASKALEASHDKKFFGSRLQVYPHEGLEVKAEFRQQDEQDEYHHKATRTLFVGNLDKSTTKEFLRDIFSKYGNIIDVDIKNQGQVTCYAFIQFDNIKSVVQALREMDDEHINNNKVKVGFGKSMPTTCVWLEGITETVSEKYLALQHLSCFGHIVALYIDRKSTRALAFYDNVEQAIVAVNELRGRVINDRRIQVDFASRDCQNMFLDAMEQSNQLRPGDRPEDRINRAVHPINGCEYVRQWSYDQAQPRNRFFPFDGLSPSRGSYNNRAGFFPPRSSATRLAIPAFYDNFEQRREGCLGIRSSFKASYEQLYDKDPLLLGRSGKERSLSLERQRSSFRGVPPDSPLSREEDMNMGLKYAEEWDISDDKKVERKRSRHSRDSGSLIVAAHDSKGSLSKKKDQSPPYQAGLPAHLFKKQHKSSRSSRSNIDIYNSQAWLRSRSDENSADVTLFVETEKNKVNIESPHKRRKSKYRADPEGFPNRSNSTVRRSKKMSDDSSSCSSSYSSSSISCVSLNSDSGGETASKSSEEVHALEQEKEKLLKLLKDMEDKDCYESDGVAVVIEDVENKEKTLKTHAASNVGDCNDKSDVARQKSRSKSDECFEQAMVNFKRKVPVTSDGDQKEDMDEGCSIKVVIEGNPQAGNRTRPSKKQLMTDKISRRRNAIDRGNKDTASHVTISDDSESCKEKFFSSCNSPSNHERLRRHSVLDAEELKDSLKPSVDRSVVVCDATYKSMELVSSDQLSATDNSVNAVVETDSIQDNEPVSLTVGDAGTMPIEPRSSDTMTRVREVMCLPLPRFAFDLPGLRRKSQQTPISETTCESRPDTSFHQSPNQMLDLPQVKQNDLTNLVPQLSKSLGDEFTNVKMETTQSSECSQIIESSSPKLACKDNEKEVDALDAGFDTSDKAISKCESDETDQVFKENIETTTSRNNEQMLIGSTSAQAVIKADDESCKSDHLDVKIGCMGTEFISSVLDDLKAETGEQNTEDDELTNSLEERIRVLDEKLSKIQQGVSKLPPSSAIAHSESAASGPAAALDYREKYKRHRKEHVPSAVTPSYEQKSEPSDLAKILLSRRSIFDQDTQRLEMLNQIAQQKDSTFGSDVSSFSHLSPGLGNIRICSLTTQQQPGHNIINDQTCSAVKGQNQSFSGSLKSNSFNKLVEVLPYPNYNLAASGMKFPDVNAKFSSDLLSSRPIVQPCVSQTSLSHSGSTGDPRRVAKPLDHSAIPPRRNIPGGIFADVIAHGDITDLHSVPLVTSIPLTPVFKSKEMVSPPVSILKKHGLSTEDASFVHSTETENVSNPLKRRSDVAFGDKESGSKHGGKIMKLENKVEGNIAKITSPKQSGHPAAALTSKIGQKSSLVKTSAGSTKTAVSQSPTLKNKVGTSLNKSNGGEKKDDKKISNENTSKSEEGIASQLCAKKEQETSEKMLKSHGDVKVKEMEEKTHQRADKKDPKPSFVKRLSAESKDEVDKKIKQAGKEVSSSSTDNPSKKDPKKEDQKTTTSLVNNKVIKMSSKSKVLPDVSLKKKEGPSRDPKSNTGKTFDKSLVNKPKIVSFKPNMDEHKEQKSSSKHSDGMKDPREDRKHPKMKLGSISGSIKCPEAMKKSAKVQMLHSSSSKDKKPEEKREVKALLQELGGGEDMNTQYFSMYDMVKRRSSKGSTPKNIEGRSKSLSQLKATSKQKQSRKNSLRVSSNDSDSNADSSSAKQRSMQTSRQKRISKSSSSDASLETSSSGGEENEAEKTESKIIKKSYQKSKTSFNKRRNIKDNTRAHEQHSTNSSSSSSDNSDNEDTAVVKSKKILSVKARSSSKKQANRSCNIYTSSDDERKKTKTCSDSTNVEPVVSDDQLTNKMSILKTSSDKQFIPKNNELIISSCSAKLSLSFSSSSSSDEYIASQIRDREVRLFEDREKIDDPVKEKLGVSNVDPVKSFLTSSEKQNFETIGSSEISQSELPDNRTSDLKADKKEWIVSDLPVKKEPSDTELVAAEKKEQKSCTTGELGGNFFEKLSDTKLEKGEDQDSVGGHANDNKDVKNIFEKLANDCFAVCDNNSTVVDRTDGSIAVSLPVSGSDALGCEKVAELDKTVPALTETDLLHSQLADNLKENSSKQETIVEAVKTISNSESDENIPMQQNTLTENNLTTAEVQRIDDDFDDVEAENNTEELDMAIKSLMCDSEEQGKVSPAVQDVSPAIVNEQQKPKDKLYTASLVDGVSSLSEECSIKVEEEKNDSLKLVGHAGECSNESVDKAKLNSEGSKKAIGEVSSLLKSSSNESECMKSDKENVKSKTSDSTGHFICTFKPEFADCQEKSFSGKHDTEFSSENDIAIDEEPSVPGDKDQKDFPDSSKKRSCDNFEDSVAKKVKLDFEISGDLASHRVNDPCKISVQSHTTEPQIYKNLITSSSDAQLSPLLPRNRAGITGNEMCNTSISCSSNMELSVTKSTPPQMFPSIHGTSLSSSVLDAFTSSGVLSTFSSSSVLDAFSSPGVLNVSSSSSMLDASSSSSLLGASSSLSMGGSSSESVPSLEIGNNIGSSNEPCSLASKQSWQTNMDRVIEDVAKGNFERGFEPDYYSLQRKHKTKNKEDFFPSSFAGTPLSQLSSTFSNSPIPSIIVPLSQSGQGLPVPLSPQIQQQQHCHRYSFGQTMPQNSSVIPSQLQYQNGSSQSQSVTIMTGSGLIQVSGANIPSLQQLQMYTAGVAAAHQFQQQNFMSPDILSQQRIVRPSVDAATIGLRPSSCYQNEQLPSPVINNLASKPAAKTYQLTGVHVHQNIPCSPVSDHPTLQTSSQMDICNVGNGCPRWNVPFGSAEEFNQRMASNTNMNMFPNQSKERTLPSTSHQRMFSSDNINCSTLGSTSISQQNPSIGHPNPQIHHSYNLNQQPYQTGPVNSSVQVHPVSSSSNNSMGHPDSLSFGGFSQSPANRHFQFDQSNFVTLEGNLRPQGNLPGFTQKHFVGVSQNVGTAVAISLPSVPNQSQLTKSIDTLHGTLRPASQKVDCRQQLFIRPLVAMQQVQTTPASSTMEHTATPSPILVGQHRMPFAIKEPRFSSNPPRAEPKTPGGNSQQSPMMVGVVGSVGQQLQHHPVQNSDSSPSQPSVNLFSGLTSSPVGLLGSAVLIPPQQQQQLALEKSILINAPPQQQQQQRFVQPATVFQYAAPAQQVSLHHLSNTSQLEFFVGGKRMVAPIIQALSTDSIMNHGHPSQANQSIHLPAHMQSSLVQQGRPSPENFDRGLSNLSQRLPVVWQGMLALKNDSAHVQMHYVSGSKNLVQASLPDNVAPLRIAQRMRLEQTQLEQVTKRMNESDFSMLLAVPCGRDPVEIMTQSHNLQTFFIHYLQQKQAAGIVNILQPNSTQTAYVVHIFPPCEFSASNLSRLPPDIVQNLVEGGYLLIIITTC